MEFKTQSKETKKIHILIITFIYKIKNKNKTIHSSIFAT